MRVPLSWLLEYAHLDLPAGPDGALGEETARAVAARLTAVGLEVETVEPAGHDISGVVVAQVPRDRGADRVHASRSGTAGYVGRRRPGPARHLRRGQLRGR